MRPRVVVIFWLCLLYVPAQALPATSSPSLPNTAPARRLAEVVARIDAGNRDSLVAYALSAFAPNMLEPDVDSIVDFLMAQHDGAGGYEVRRVIESSDEQIAVVAQGRREPHRWVRLVVGAESVAPHRVRGIFLFPASAALAEIDTAMVSNTELPARLAQFVDRLAAQGDFSGSVCLSQGDSIVLDRAWGEADRDTHRPNETDTPFGIASLGKMFTAVAMAQLVEQGRLRYQDRVVEYIPNWLAPASREITIEQLLTHTSGLGDYLDAVRSDRAKDYGELGDYRALAVVDTPAFQPGTHFRYSNMGYVLLGAVIEAVSGEPWDRYLERHIFAPAKMVSSFAYRSARNEGSIAIGYAKDETGVWSSNTAVLAGRGTSAGGSVSTARDLVAFANALRSGRLVSPESFARMTMPRVNMEGTGLSYGLGFTIAQDEAGRRVYGHAGGYPGVGALLEVYEEAGYVLAVLSNMTAAAQQVGDAWRDLLRRNGAP